MDEIKETVETYRTNLVEFSDDTFTLNRPRLIELCDKLKASNLDLKWTCLSRVDTISKELMVKMKAAGCYGIYFGVESSSQETLDRIRKNIKIEQVIKAFKWAKEVGIETMASFMIGFPWETKEKMRQTIEFAVKLDPDYAQFAIVTPYPGTKFYEEVKQQEGMMITDDWADFTAAKPVIATKNFSAEELKQLLVYAYKRFYSRGKLLLRQVLKRRLRLAYETVKNLIKAQLLKPKKVAG